MSSRRGGSTPKNALSFLKLVRGPRLYTLSGLLLLLFCDEELLSGRGSSVYVYVCVCWGE